MSERKVKLVLPTGRMNQEVVRLLAEAGLELAGGGNNYRPRASDPRFEIKLLKAANIPKLVEYGAHDMGFSGWDWVQETEADVETILDTELLPVRIVAAAPIGVDPLRTVRDRPLVVASEYERLTASFMNSKNVKWTYVRTYGSTEVFPPEDADLVVDNTATGSTLAANRLEIIDELLRSTTLFIVNRRSLENPFLRERVEDLRLLIQSVLDARKRVLLEMNVEQPHLDAVAGLLPAMKAPTIQPLQNGRSFAVKAAVPRKGVADLILALRKAGATDILQTQIVRVVP